MTAIDPDFENTQGEAIKAFLSSPLNRKHFDDFFLISHRQAIGYLRYLKRRGYLLPSASSDSAQLFEDLAIDVLGPFFCSERDRPFYLVLDYFEKQIPGNIEKTDARVIYHLFTILIRGFIKQELFRLSKEEDPQTANLKRRISDILNKPPYVVVKDSKSGTELVSLVANEEYLRLDQQPIASDVLVSLVEEAYLESRSVTSWCGRIFAILNESVELQNRLFKHELLSAVVIVCARHIELECFEPPGFPGPREYLMRQAIEEAKARTLAWTESGVLADFVLENRISQDQSEALLRAVDTYLTDFSNHGNCDSIPDYFREVMPETDHGRYLKDFKYVFETIISKAVEEFRRRLKNDPTIRRLGDY